MRLKPGMEEEYAKYVEMNSEDGYSKGVVDYTERWAGLLERAIGTQTISNAIEHTIRSVAKDASHEADTDGITGFMYGCAVQALAHFWEHGETLRCWHNLDTQIRDEGEKANESGGVLNPAVMTINV